VLTLTNDAGSTTSATTDTQSTMGTSDATASESEDSLSESDTSSADGNATSGPLLDIGSSGTGTATMTAGDAGDEACEKVDILFAVDTSGSMADEQAALLSAFPAFAASMLDTLDTVQSLHVGVVASGPFTGNDPATCVTQGALVTQSQCLPFAEGSRFITDVDDIGSAFNCNAALGLGGPGDNTTMQNVIMGVSELDGAGECNEGFIRDDALLVIVIITDEEDDYDNPPGFNYFGSPGDPASWYADIVAAKAGIETNIVVASFVQPPEPNMCPESNNTTLLDWFEANRIIEFTNSFSNHVVHDICDTAGYPSGFAEALGFIDSACDGFIPPG
jgi:hypothetical protein